MTNHATHPDQLVIVYLPVWGAEGDEPECRVKTYYPARWIKEDSWPDYELAPDEVQPTGLGK